MNDKMVDAYEIISKLAFENPDVRYVDLDAVKYDVYTQMKDMFTSGQALYYANQLAASITMRNAELEFGIIPPPKYDEEQKSYYTTSHDQRSMFVIPTDVPDADFAGMITEALCVASRKYVVPAYIDMTLKGKAVRDDESAEMLDIIRNGFKLEFAAEYAMQNSRSGYIIRFTLKSGQGIMSYYAENTYKTGFENFLKAYED